MQLRISHVRGYRRLVPVRLASERAERVVHLLQRGLALSVPSAPVRGLDRWLRLVQRPLRSEGGLIDAAHPGMNASICVK